MLACMCLANGTYTSVGEQTQPREKFYQPFLGQQMQKICMILPKTRFRDCFSFLKTKISN